MTFDDFANFIDIYCDIDNKFDEDLIDAFIMGEFWELVYNAGMDLDHFNSEDNEVIAEYVSENNRTYNMVVEVLDWVKQSSYDSFDFSKMPEFLVDRKDRDFTEDMLADSLVDNFLHYYEDFFRGFIELYPVEAYLNDEDDYDYDNYDEIEEIDDDDRY